MTTSEHENLKSFINNLEEKLKNDCKFIKYSNKLKNCKNECNYNKLINFFEQFYKENYFEHLTQIYNKKYKCKAMKLLRKNSIFHYYDNDNNIVWKIGGNNTFDNYVNKQIDYDSKIIPYFNTNKLDIVDGVLISSCVTGSGNVTVLTFIIIINQMINVLSTLNSDMTKITTDI
jgi:hypothetical protein